MILKAFYATFYALTFGGMLWPVLFTAAAMGAAAGLAWVIWYR